MQMTQLVVKTGATVYTELTPDEVRAYLADGSKTGTIYGYLNADKSVPIYIGVHAIVYVIR